MIAADRAGTDTSRATRVVEMSRLGVWCHFIFLKDKIGQKYNIVQL